MSGSRRHCIHQLLVNTAFIGGGLSGISPWGACGLVGVIQNSWSSRDGTKYWYKEPRPNLFPNRHLSWAQSKSLECLEASRDPTLFVFLHAHRPLYPPFHLPYLYLFPGIMLCTARCCSPPSLFFPSHRLFPLSSHPHLYSSSEMPLPGLEVPLQASCLTPSHPYPPHPPAFSSSGFTNGFPVTYLLHLNQTKGIWGQDPHYFHFLSAQSHSACD